MRRSLLQSLGISLRSATEPIDETSTGKLMEGVLAAFAQFDNDCRSDRTRAGMKAALELGRWVFLAPLGYLNAPRAIGTSLMPIRNALPIVRRVFEAYATGRFTKQQVLRQARAWGSACWWRELAGLPTVARSRMQASGGWWPRFSPVRTH